MACPPIVGREGWDARPPKTTLTKLRLPTPHIVLGQTARPERLTYDACKKEVFAIQQAHMFDDPSRKWDDIGMNFMICGDGTIFEGRGWASQGAFNPNWNNRSQSIYFLGDYSERSTREPPAAALESARQLIRCGVSNGTVQEGYTIYGNYLYPKVPVLCACGPISAESIPWTTTGRPRVGPPEVDSPSLNPNYLYGILGGVLGFTLLLSLLFGWIWKRRHGTNALEKKVRLRCAWALTHYEIPPKNISLVNPLAGPDKLLGKGNFGIVLKGRLIDWKSPNFKVGTTMPEKQAGDLFVAVKLLPEDKRDDAIMNNFVQEMEMLMKVGRHVNIVNFIGVVLVGEPMIVMEYCSLGSLDKFLRNPKNNSLSGSTELAFSTTEKPNYDYYLPIRDALVPDIGDLENQYVIVEDLPLSKTPKISSVDDLVYFGFQISRGMDFVFSRNMIHRDLAARNVLLNSAMTVKIADFGMARDNTEYVMQSDSVELPLRWLAPESIMRRGSYNVKSDVWSFGVTLWEIMTLGRLPYEDELPKGLSCEQLRDFLSSNSRLGQPFHASDSLYGIMQQCWAKEPADRPLFAELTGQLGALLPPHLQHAYLKLDEEYCAFNEKLDKDYYSTHL